MKRTTVLLCTGAVIGMAGTAMGQWSDNFDSYDTVQPLPDQSTWEGWDGAAGASDFYATTDQALSSPNSLAADGGDDCVHQYSGYSAGVWAYTAWQYIPSDAADIPTYLILLNTYIPDGSTDTNNWSMQLQCNPDLNILESEFEGATLPLKTGQWVKFYNIIDLDQDLQTIYYDDTLLVQKSWKEGVSGGGEANIAAVDLWANNSTYTTYYDDMELAEVPPFGACCFLDGSCEDDLSEDDCVFMQGNYQGHGTTCDLVTCLELGECGWVLPMDELGVPFQYSGNTCEESDSCDLRPSPDAQFEVILPYAAEWTFSVCQAQWDTYVYLSTTCCPESGSPDILAEVDDSPGCGAASEVIIELEAGTYYFTIEGFSEVDCGPFPLLISSPCVVECDPECLLEDEVDCFDFYIDDYNGGCNSDPPVFSLMDCNTCVCGTGGNFTGEGGATRDTDWYAFELPADDTVVTLGGIAEFELQLLLIDPGPGDCSETPEGDPTYTVIGSRTIPPCESQSFDRIMDLGETGKGWAWAGTSGYEGVPCGSIYNMYLACQAGPECPADITGDGVVDVLDLLEVLSQWGGSGTADINGDGVVDVLDLLEVLGAWGPC